LAVSLVLRPEALLAAHPGGIGDWLPRLAGLGALVVCDGLESRYGLQPEIKWPNDVLLRRRKTAGVLAEAHWQAGQLQAHILGIGVNVALGYLPPESELAFPATCIECVLGRPVERWDLLRVILERLIDWRTRLAEPEFLSAWEGRLAFRGEKVWLSRGEGKGIEGEVLGLTPEGSLRLRLADGEERSFHFGEVQLRPVDTRGESAKLES
jgi:BirA family biotin operon repressor/biotin-[acetyl-CoA-carboxylase] ligase